MLEIQKFLRNGGTLQQLKDDLFIDFKYYNDLIIINYNQISSPMDDLRCQEARGLILEDKTFNIVNKSFNKFFNYGEGFAEVIDLNNASIQEKVDGSIIGFWNYQGKWRVSTKKVIDAGQEVEKCPGVTFYDVILMAIRDMGYTFETFTNLLNSNYSYSFELVSPETQVQIFYPERKLYLLGAWAVSTGEEVLVSDLPFPRPNLFSIQAMSMADLAKIANELDCSKNEGYVVVEGTKRVKVKNSKYVFASKMKDACYHPRHMIELIQLEKYDDVISVLPEFWANKLKNIQEKVINLLNEVEMNFKKIKHIELQKDFAMEALKYKYSSMLFSMRKTGKSAVDLFKSYQPDNILSYIGYET